MRPDALRSRRLPLRTRQPVPRDSCRTDRRRRDHTDWSTARFTKPVSCRPAGSAGRDDSALLGKTVLYVFSRRGSSAELVHRAGEQLLECPSLEPKTIDGCAAPGSRALPRNSSAGGAAYPGHAGRAVARGVRRRSYACRYVAGADGTSGRWSQLAGRADGLRGRTLSRLRK